MAPEKMQGPKEAGLWYYHLFEVRRIHVNAQGMHRRYPPVCAALAIAIVMDSLVVVGPNDGHGRAVIEGVVESVRVPVEEEMKIDNGPGMELADR